MKGFGLTPLLGDRRGFMPPQLKTKKQTNGVIIFNTSNSFSYIEGPNMIEDRFNHACSIIVSPAHEGRPLAIMAGKNTAEVLDFSIPGSNWQLSKYLYLCGFKYDLRMETFHWKGNN